VSISSAAIRSESNARNAKYLWDANFANPEHLAPLRAVPIPSKPTMDDGLHYVPNPRFSPEGYWRERRFWPADLR
jgi:hypothetical protein